jgi:hypothetical protein
MPESRRKRPRDPAQLAKLIVDIGTGEVEDREPTPEELGKSASAVARGKVGGPKGGRARGMKLDPAKRAEIGGWRHKRGGKNPPNYAISFSCANSSKSTLKLRSICIG